MNPYDVQVETHAVRICMFVRKRYIVYDTCDLQIGELPESHNGRGLLHIQLSANRSGLAVPFQYSDINCIL